MERKQLDANSCGLCLVTGMYLIKLPEISRHAIFFKSATVCKNEIALSKSGMFVLTVLYWKSDKKNASVDFLIQVLTNDPKTFEYFRQSKAKEIYINFFFITDISKTSIPDINTDDSGGYWWFMIYKGLILYTVTYHL